MIELTVNGQARKFDGDGDMPILWYLRDELDLTGAKFGCGMGLCGACTIHLNGEAIRSCVTPLKTAAGKRITTIEGLSANGTHPCQAAWEKHNVAQCGYCQSGQIMQAAALLKKTPSPPTRRSIAPWMATSAAVAPTLGFAPPSRPPRG
jgi:isoquinoline 1-oxidoreductase alpha subunit